MKRAILLLALGVPTSLAAQSGTTTVVSTYLASDAGVSGGPLLVGLNVTREQGWTGMRVGAAVDAGSTIGGGGSGSGVGVLSADVDAMLHLDRLFTGAPVAPYLLAGVGGRLLSGASTGAAVNWGYGAGARTPITGHLALEGEIRYREPIGEMDVDAGQRAGLEYRFGASVRFGRALARPRAVPVTPFPRPVLTTAGAAASPLGNAMAAARRRVAERALDTADDYLGVRYTWGGNGPEEGFDCSGFVRFVFAKQGIDLPRVSRDQARVGTPLPLDISLLEPGDLMAFAPPGGVVDHIGIYAGNGRIIHSSSSGRGVRIDDLYSERGRWFRENMVAARRVIDGGALLAAQ
jgi:cell wall-associated NlpC family hydrolase